MKAVIVSLLAMLPVVSSASVVSCRVTDGTRVQVVTENSTLRFWDKKGDLLLNNSATETRVVGAATVYTYNGWNLEIQLFDDGSKSFAGTIQFEESGSAIYKSEMACKRQ
ncbi:hypothetical protein [Bdellovibrio sp. HCB2-146]|uniref:hypothetical protein n=1 Tax=Bdellovibrio sp. HCB2-146 TaxID=3394362 RepID=UPI0039BC9652